MISLEWFYKHYDRNRIEPQETYAVYALSLCDKPIHKVSSSQGLVKRFRANQTNSPREICVSEIIWIDGSQNANAILKRLHATLKLSGTHLRGDWFNADQSVLSDAFAGLENDWVVTKFDAIKALMEV